MHGEGFEERSLFLLCFVPRSVSSLQNPCYNAAHTRFSNTARWLLSYLHLRDMFWEKEAPSVELSFFFLFFPPETSIEIS